MSILSLAPESVLLKGLKSLLRREPWASSELSKYAGKTVLVRLGEKDLLLATICSDGALMGADAAIVPDVVLTMPFSDIATMVSTWRTQGPDGLARQIHIQGEAGLAQLLGELARNLRWDVESDLAGVVGDIAAVRITGFMRQAVSGLQHNAKRVDANLRQYLTEESDLAVKHSELDDFGTDLVSLNRRLDSIEARVNKLARQ